MKYLFFFVLVGVFADETRFFHLKQMLNKGEIESVIKQSEELLKEYPADATLALYQAEAYTQRGERFYRRRKFKSAFLDYEKVYKVWQNNLLVQTRYNELKSIPNLKDEPDEIDKNVVSMLVPFGLQGGLEKRVSEELAKPKTELSEEAKILLEHTKKMENLFFISLLFFGVINLSFLFLLIQRRNK